MYSMYVDVKMFLLRIGVRHLKMLLNATKLSGGVVVYLFILFGICQSKGKKKNIFWQLK